MLLFLLGWQGLESLSLSLSSVFTRIFAIYGAAGVSDGEDSGEFGDLLYIFLFFGWGGRKANVAFPRTPPHIMHLTNSPSCSDWSVCSPPPPPPPAPPPPPPSPPPALPPPSTRAPRKANIARGNFSFLQLFSLADCGERGRLRKEGEEGRRSALKIPPPASPIPSLSFPNCFRFFSRSSFFLSIPFFFLVREARENVSCFSFRNLPPFSLEPFRIRTYGVLLPYI